MDKNTLSLKVLKDFKPILKIFRQIELDNSDILSTYSDIGAILCYKAKFTGLFYFRIDSSRVDPSGDVYYEWHIKPTDDESPYSTRGEGTGGELTRYFKEWVSLVREYDEISLTDEEAITKQYEEEFYAEFEILDDDASTSAFNSAQQEQLYLLFTDIEEQLKQANEVIETQHLIDEVIVLKQNIQNLTKQQLIKAMSKFFTKIKKTGLSLFFDILKEGKKHIIKQIIEGTFTEAGKLLD